MKFKVGGKRIVNPAGMVVVHLGFSIKTRIPPRRRAQKTGCWRPKTLGRKGRRREIGP
jgi:hypothetical protein